MAEDKKSLRPTTVKPFFMFNGTHSEDFMKQCSSIFDDTKQISIEKYGADGPGPEGSIKLAEFQIHGQSILCSDSYMKHDFTFTGSTSLFVDCSDDAQIGRYVEAISKDGKTMMPLDNYGFSKKFAWIADRFGISWQLNLPAE